jgi:hypothetical protein
VAVDAITLRSSIGPPARYHLALVHRNEAGAEGGATGLNAVTSCSSMGPVTITSRSCSCSPNMGWGREVPGAQGRDWSMGRERTTSEKRRNKQDVKHLAETYLTSGLIEQFFNKFQFCQTDQTYPRSREITMDKKSPLKSVTPHTINHCANRDRMIVTNLFICSCHSSAMMSLLL